MMVMTPSKAPGTGGLLSPPWEHTRPFWPGAKKTIYLIYSFEFIITYIYLAILENYSENSDNLSNLFF